MKFSWFIKGIVLLRVCCGLCIGAAHDSVIPEDLSGIRPDVKLSLVKEPRDWRDESTQALGLYRVCLWMGNKDSELLREIGREREACQRSVGNALARMRDHEGEVHNLRGLVERAKGYKRGTYDMVLGVDYLPIIGRDGTISEFIPESPYFYGSSFHLQNAADAYLKTEEFKARKVAEFEGRVAGEIALVEEAKRGHDAAMTRLAAFEEEARERLSAVARGDIGIINRLKSAFQTYGNICDKLAYYNEGKVAIAEGLRESAHLKYVEARVALNELLEKVDKDLIQAIVSDMEHREYVLR